MWLGVYRKQSEACLLGGSRNDICSAKVSPYLRAGAGFASLEFCSPFFLGWFACIIMATQGSAAVVALSQNADLLKARNNVNKNSNGSSSKSKYIGNSLCI